MEGLAMQEELSGPVEGAAETAGCGVSEGAGFVLVRWF